MKVVLEHRGNPRGQGFYGMAAAAGADLGLGVAEQATARYGAGEFVPVGCEYVDIKEPAKRMCFLKSCGGGLDGSRFSLDGEQGLVTGCGVMRELRYGWHLQAVQQLLDGREPVVKETAQLLVRLDGAGDIEAKGDERAAGCAAWQASVLRRAPPGP